MQKKGGEILWIIKPVSTIQAKQQASMDTVLIQNMKMRQVKDQYHAKDYHVKTIKKEKGRRSRMVYTVGNKEFLKRYEELDKEQ